MTILTIKGKYHNLASFVLSTFNDIFFLNVFHMIQYKFPIIDLVKELITLFT